MLIELIESCKYYYYLKNTGSSTEGLLGIKADDERGIPQFIPTSRNNK